MDIRKVKKLIELLESSSIDEIEIHEGEESVRVRRHPPPAPAPTFMHVPAGYAPAAMAPAPAAHPAAAPEAPAEPALDGHVLTSPMVGTFYESPSPGAKPFVTVGQPVAAGDTVCVIEAMKILNQIECDCAGVVKAVLVDNGRAVEFGQPLLLIDPA